MTCGISCGKRDAVAMNDLLGLLAPWIGRICGSIALEQGEDATQEALMIVLRRLRTLREPDALRGWERAIAAREAVRLAQRAPSTAPLLDLPPRDDVEMATDIRLET